MSDDAIIRMFTVPRDWWRGVKERRKEKRRINRERRQILEQRQRSISNNLEQEYVQSFQMQLFQQLALSEQRVQSLQPSIEVGWLSPFYDSMRKLNINVRRTGYKLIPEVEYCDLECNVCYNCIEEDKIDEGGYYGKLMIQFGCNENHIVCAQCAINILESTQIGGRLGVCHLRCGQVYNVYLQHYVCSR